MRVGQWLPLWLGLWVGPWLGACTVDTAPQALADRDGGRSNGEGPGPDGGTAQPGEHDGGGKGDAGKRDGGRTDVDAADTTPDRDSAVGTEPGSDGGNASADSGAGPAPDSGGGNSSDPCASKDCGPHARCSASAGVAACSCDTGYQDNDRDGSCEPACMSDSCPAHAICADGSGAVVCSCRDDYQDNDGDGNCEPACSASSCPTHSTCADDSGAVACTCTKGYSGSACSDTDACMAADQVDANPCNDADETATCVDKAAPSTDYSCHCDAGFTSTNGTCVDIDECAASNGGCGDPAFYHCENNPGAPPDCSDIDECATDNGGCGDAEFTLCTNHDGAAPDCDDIEQCATDNGGCGNPLRATCHENPGAAPTCECEDQYAGPGCAYHLVYGIDLPVSAPGWVDAGQIPYDADNSGNIAPFDRVAYRLQLDDTWIWVEVDAFTDDPTALGIPADETFDQALDHVTVRTNASNVDEVTDAPGGKMEFWSHCYGPGPDGELNDSDERSAIDCFGSMQLHRDGSTLLAFNHWATNVDSIDVGIGQGSPPDWTYANNGGSYMSRRLEVYVHELATCTPESCSQRGSCDDSSGIVVCDCDQGYDGALCELCASDYQDNDGDGVCEQRCAPGACTTPGEYCFDDSGTTECLSEDGSDCATILQADPGAVDGTYVVDFDGAGVNDPRLSYCDMSHGGFTLLAVANPRSTAFGNNSPLWSQSAVLGSTVLGLDGRDYRGCSYSELTTTVIRLCRGDLDHCHDFLHGLGISLQDFFFKNVSYDQYASNIYGHANTPSGSDSARTQYLSEIGAEEAGTMCGYWLGINEQNMHSGIGLMGDANDGCATGTLNHWIDDLAIGVGLQSCADNNSCSPGGTKNTAGRQQGWVGQSGDIGPWFMLGK